MSDWMSYDNKYKLEFWDSAILSSTSAYYITVKNEKIDYKAYIVGTLYSRKDALQFMLNIVMGIFAIERIVKQIEYDFRESVPIVIHRIPVNVRT